jgi:hypothetical protein
LIEYPKIDTLYTRDEKFNLTEELRHPVLATISPWVVTEKVDGTNIRVHLDAENKVSMNGRTANAQIPGDLVQHVLTACSAEKLAALRMDQEPVTITLFGEGFGAGIQKGGDYGPQKRFILFDVLISDQWWLRDEAVTEIAGKLGIPRVPILGRWTLEAIRDAVRAGIPSVVAEGRRNMEGIVARPVEPLFDAMRKRVILKLKTTDWTLRP